MVIEFKVFDPKIEKTLEETAERALLQIEEKRYDVELMDMGIQKASIRHYGFAFRGKEILILDGYSTGEIRCSTTLQHQRS